MKNTLSILSVCLLAAGAAQAVLVDLGVAADGNYVNGSVITNTTSFSGATFDILYTLGSVGSGGTSSIESSGSIMGVRSVADGTTSTHYTTIEGNDAEGISFTGLTIANFNAGTSDFVIGDIENLTFNSISLGAVGSQRDDGRASFSGFGVSETDIELGLSLGTNVYTIAVPDLTGYSAPETDVYLRADTAWSSNRWNVSGIEVAYTIPEPATLGLVASCAFGVLFIRRRFMM